VKFTALGKDFIGDAKCKKLAEDRDADGDGWAA